MMGGMRIKTSLTLDETTIPLARERAKAAHLDVSHWVEQAIRHEAARNDVDELEAWEQRLNPDEQGILVMFADLDRTE